MAGSLRRKLRQMNRTRFLSAEERARQILDDRTEHLANRPDNQAAMAAETVRVLVCGAGREQIGLAVEQIAEVLSDRECIPVPESPPGLIGFFGRGGRLISVIDLTTALGVAPESSDDGNRHLVLLRREQPHVALRVDRAYAVADVLPLGGEAGAGFRNEAVTGYAQPPSDLADQSGVLSLLDLDRLLRPFLPSSASGVSL